MWKLKYCNSVSQKVPVIVYKSLDEEMIELRSSIMSAIAKECDCAETVKGRSHCHNIDPSDVLKDVAKLTRCTRGDARRFFFCTYKTYLYAQKKEFLMNVFKYCLKNYIKLHEFANSNSANYDV